MRKALTITAGIAAIAALGYVGTADVDAQKVEERRYCEMVAIHDAQAARGIPPSERDGHHDYRGIADERCPGMRRAS